MLGVFVGETRIGSILHFPHEKCGWYAYSIHTTERPGFRLKREAVAWLKQQHETAAPLRAKE